MLILDNSFAKVQYHATHKYIEFEYKRFGSSEEFRQAWITTAKFAIQHKVMKWISNAAKIGVVRPEDQQWFIEALASEVRSKNAGTTHVAVILEDNIFAEVSVKNIMSNIGKQAADQPFIFRYFSQLHEAREWIEQLKASAAAA